MKNRTISTDSKQVAVASLMLSPLTWTNLAASQGSRSEPTGVAKRVHQIVAFADLVSRYPSWLDFFVPGARGGNKTLPRRCLCQAQV